MRVCVCDICACICIVARGIIFACLIKDVKDNINITTEESNDGRVQIKLGSFPIAVSTETFPVQANADKDRGNFQLGESHVRRVPFSCNACSHLAMVDCD